MLPYSLLVRILAGLNTHRLLPWARVSLLICFIVTAIGVGFGFYRVVSVQQSERESVQYETWTRKIESSIVASLLAKRAAMSLAGKLAMSFCPTATLWPDCRLPHSTLHTLASPLCRQSTLSSLSLAVLVMPDQDSSFEAFARDYFEGSNYPVSPSVRRLSGGVSSTQYDVLTPVIQVSDIISHADELMLDLHSVGGLSVAIDSVLDCVGLSLSQDSLSPAWDDSDDEGGALACAAEVMLASNDTDGPIGITLSPVVLVANRTSVVGLIAAEHDWVAVLSAVADPQLLRGIVVVVSVDAHTHTFSYSVGGTVAYWGEGDLHSPKYSSRRYECVLPTFSGYTVSLYPSEDWDAQFMDSLPSLLCGVSAGLVGLSLALVALYDVLLRRLSARKDAQLLDKKMFVRHISHEIRTPLNAVILGLHSLSEELRSFFSPSLSRQRRTRDDFVTQFADWVDLTGDVVEGADTAIHLLNDLMNFDKLSAGSVVIEREVLSLGDILSTSLSPMQTQAQTKGVALSVSLFSDERPSLVPPAPTQSVSASFNNDGVRAFDSESSKSEQHLSPVPEEEVKEEPSGDSFYSVARSLIVLGDRAKLTSALRQVVSLSIACTASPGGVVLVRAEWRPHGLPEAFPHIVGDVLHSAGDQTFLDSLVVSLHNYVPCGSVCVTVSCTGSVTPTREPTAGFKPGGEQQGQGGLGLWVARGMVDLHRGTLSTMSESDGRGTAFTIELPVMVPRWSQQSLPLEVRSSARSLKVPSDDSVSKHSQSLSDHSVSVPPTEGPIGSVPPALPAAKASTTDDLVENFKRVLVVDDSDVIRKMVCRSLKPLGFECVQAEDGLQCVEMLQGGAVSVDLILMDYEMPRLSGPLAVEKLRSLGIVTPVVGVTGNVMKEESEYYMQCGADKVIHKPFTVKTLERALHELLLSRSKDPFERVFEHALK